MTWGDNTAIRKLSTEDNCPLSEVVYAYRQTIKKLIPVTTAFPLGISTSALPSLRSEYFSFSDDLLKASSLKNYMNKISLLPWDQFYVPDLIAHSFEWCGFRDAAALYGWAFVIKNVENTYGVDVSGGSFADYLKGLGGGARLKLFNRRKNLQALGTVQIKNIWPNKELFFSLINQFHLSRWGRPCYQGDAAEFMSLLLDKLNAAGHRIDLSVMSLNEQPISVVLDISINGRIYNLQSGYVEQLSKNISLGTLHFGYQIEKAFLSHEIDFYDFMAGNGKNSNYKVALANKVGEFNTILLVRNPMLKLIYRLQQGLKRH